VQGYTISVANQPAGVLLFGRPQCQRLLPWYGSLDDLRLHRCTDSRWSILNLARVYFFPAYQRDPVSGYHGRFYSPEYLPGFADRNGIWHSTLASTAIDLALDSIPLDYLRARPPVYLDEPYEIRWCLSYSDPHFHKETLYKQSYFEPYHTNKRGLVTWRRPLRVLTSQEDGQIRLHATISPRSQRYQAARRAETWIKEGAISFSLC
jgi:hypothetical protein